MTRTMLTFVTVLAVSALLTVPATAQAPVAPQAGPWGAQIAPTKEQIDYLKKTEALHSKIRATQLDVLSLRQQNADQKKIEAKVEEITKLRTQLHELNVTNRPALGAGLGWGMGRGPFAWGAAPGLGLGRGPCGMGLGLGQGAGYGWQQGWRGGRAGGPGYGRRGGRGGGRGWRGMGPGGYGPFCPYRTF